MRKTDAHADLNNELDLDQMLTQFNTILTANKILDKSKSTGSSLKDLSVVVESGRTKCVTKEEKNRSTSLRRKQLIEKMRKRMVRGDCSLANDITNRIRRCQDLIHVWNLVSNLGDKENVTLRRNLESIYNRAASLVKEVRVLEGAIERKKEEDPVIKEVEEANSELLKAMHDKDTERVKELKKFCKDNMETYNLRKKRLRPYLAKARQARLKFISEKRRLMRFQFELYSKFADHCAENISMGTLNGLASEEQGDLINHFESIRQICSSASEILQELDKPLGQVAVSFLPDVEAEVEKIDELFLSKLDENVDEIMRLIRKGHSAKANETVEEPTDTSKRMTYQEKQEQQ